MTWITDANNRIHLHVKVMLAVVYGLTLYPMLEIGFTMQDDALLALAYQSKSLSPEPISYLIHSAVKESQYFGRVWVIYGSLMSYLPFAFHSAVYYKIVAFTSLTLNVVLFFFVLQRLFRTLHFALLAVVLFLAFLQNSLHYNLITSFVAHFMTGISFLFASVLLFDRYLNTKKTWHHAGAGLCLFMSFFTYELFVLYYCLIPVLVLSSVMERHSLTRFKEALPHWREIVRELVPTAAVLLVYLIIYAGYRLAYPTKYTGIEIAFSPARYIESVYRLTIGALPISLYYRHSYDSVFAYLSENLQGHRSSIFYVLVRAHADWLARAVLLAFLALVVLRDRPKRMSGRNLLWLCGFCLFLFWIPGTLPSLTSRYQIFVQMGLPMYLVTSFSYYAFIVALTAVLIFVNERINHSALRRALHAIVVVIVFSWSILTDYTNFYVAKLQSQNQRQWLIMDDFMHTPEFAAVPAGSIVYAPTLWQHSPLAPMVEVKEYWQDYIRAMTLKKLSIIKTESEFKRAFQAGELAGVDVYYLKFSQERKDPNQFLVFAKVNSSGVQNGRPFFRADHAAVFMRSAYREYTAYVPLSGIEKTERVIVDGEERMLRGSFVAAPLDKSSVKGDLIKTEFRAPAIDIERISVSNYVEQYEFPYNEKPNVEYDLEQERRKLLHQ
ncbi:MAG TPA: hypothetical protein PKE49_06710 [Leptospiraceae bacterium]|nr:glucosyltransferase domain-containing protein [Leptospirales bacterium]HMU83097.1 hypothetical protein [Leptospiraceae bacterium]HMX56196.1 hypothetical protein [Leptospiraceae bacterium]HMZ36202.1 hypothetical protein [Leptospiraceae bacterium]HNE23580.1 hypothetical protein [Leptospiraceae bacterium]